ncbi:hypothetical protein D9613_011438 [Agrocybe pediades]|uniref:Ketoreductase (KR) domain-containing protein n=1 Tax=Agrocybe pediades TaxID=84607 RepID=A0A8H4VQ63_9AGAR|nr:hypothetical protein D9613_011438 [Agrocybe pediades]KAF9563326.1 hypothetical protein CPC08DRAFT_706041 [Agrocybe pediades]
MPSYTACQQANTSFNPSFVPTMVITGSISEIGRSMVEIIARHLNGRIHIVLVGRNKSVAEAIIASLPLSNDSTYEFMYCNVMLMKNVHALAKELSAKLPKLNYLVHCAGVFGLGGRDETEEGINSRLAARYYSRFALTNDLLRL